MKKVIRVTHPKGSIIKQYEILECMGYSYSSLIYRVYDKQTQQLKILKEFYPYILAKNNSLWFNPFSKKIESIDNQPYYSGEYKYEKDLYKNFYKMQDIKLIEAHDKEFLLFDSLNSNTLSYYMSELDGNNKLRKMQTLSDIITLTINLLESIHPLHKQGYIHGNILPDNLLIEYKNDFDVKSSHYKIINVDLVGIYKETDKFHSEKSAFKTYAPLEFKVDNCKNKISYSSDIYSVAAIVFKILYNQYFHRLEHTSIKDNIIQFNSDLSSPYFTETDTELAKSFNAILCNALSKHYGNCEVMISELKNIGK